MFDYKTGKDRPNTFIDDTDKYGYYDYLCTITIQNLIQFEDNLNLEIEDYTDPMEKFLVHCASIAANYRKTPISFKMPFFDYILLIAREFGRSGFKAFKFYKKKMGKTITATEILTFEAEANKIDPFLFSDIYYEYYNKKGLKR